jgi:hypothetical protein
MNTETAYETDSDRGREIAAEIVRQIGRGTMMSLGARELVFYPYGENGQRGGIFFTVGNGRWKCEVVLEGNDTYTVRFQTKKAGNVRYECAGVYFDNLAEILHVGFHEALYGRR